MSETVLLVDDDPVLLQLMSSAFAAAGFRVFTADDGRKGVRMAQTCAPDLVVTDIVMPELEGIGLIRAIRQSHPAPKVIAISGAGRGRGRDYLSWARHLGADEALAKPFRMSELLRAAKALLNPQDQTETVSDMESCRAHSSR